MFTTFMYLIIYSENKDTLDVDAATPSFCQATPQTTATEKCDRAVSTYQVTKQVQQTDEILSRLEQIETAISSLQDVSRLEQIETAISSLQDANDKSTDDISEIKQWRDNFVTEQSDMGVNIEQLTKKQKQNFKNLRKQMSEQDNKVKELNKEFENLKEYENKLNKINKEIQDHTDKTGSITQEIKRLSDLIVILQDENNKILDKTSTRFEKLHSKHSVMYKLLQQRLMPIDKLIQIFNQNLETRKERINKLDQLENTISKLSNDFPLIESRVCNRYACHVELDDRTPVSAGSIISTFSEVREYNGQHFNQTTGKFVSPHDGLYLVCVTLNKSKDNYIVVNVMVRGRWCMSIEVKYAYTSAAGSVIVDMKKGQELYLEVSHADQGATLSYLSSFSIVSL
ncbi:uncharacterized protein LOC131944698 [Physella acuta]|uniref:uncharacterized protein LOC131944698 n=1 Tax=Physella acuta TaxID=109671 RepID=UPI0027DBD595|nr:uncharacterized protein LOC131944698 [Physella acuta]